MIPQTQHNANYNQNYTRHRRQYKRERKDDVILAVAAVLNVWLQLQKIARFWKTNRMEREKNDDVDDGDKDAVYK